MNKQQVFDKVVTELWNQGGPSIEEVEEGYKVCKYRSDTGRKCAVGVLIKDHEYSKLMEGTSVRSLPVRCDYWCIPLPSILVGISYAEVAFLDALQNAHDKRVCKTWDKRFFEAFRRVAERYDLNTDTLDIIEAQA